MSQDSMIKFKCQKCKRINYYSTKNKKLITEPVELKKYCKFCKVRTPHKESKK